MKIVLRVALCALLITGCKFATSNETAFLKGQIDDLNTRMKSLEDELLKAEKTQIQQQQQMEQMRDQMRTMATYFDKMQYGSTTTQH